ncbi:MAG: DUF2304 domain-containing protein [Geodermatophilaceae bacterium]
MVIQFILLAAVGLGFLLFVRRWHGVRMQAGKRIGLVAFTVLNIYAVLRPNDVTWVANRLGVGRGADLVLYVLVIAFMLGMLNFYLRFKTMDRRLTELARTIAIREAEIVNRERGLLAPHDVTVSVPDDAVLSVPEAAVGDPVTGEV